MKKQSGKLPSTPWEINESMFLSEAEVDNLLRYLRDVERESPPSERNRRMIDRLIIEILVFSGIQNSELCRLKVDDTEAGHGQPYLRIDSTSPEARYVYLPNALSREISNYVYGSRSEMIQDRERDETAQVLIVNERGRPYDRTALYRRVVRILSAAGLGDRASVQLLRHTYGFLAYKRSQGNLLFVQQQLGHAHPMVTAVYAQFVQFSYAKLADATATTTPPAVDEIVPSTNPSSSQKRKSRK